MTETDPQKIAEAAAKAMFDRDNASQALGMEVVAVGPGMAELAMTVREDMVNGHGTCHGGLIFTLADSAFAFGCNSHNRATVAVGCEIAFVAPGKLGDRLTARCTERHLSGRNGVYDIDVTNQTGEKIAFFRGKSRQIKGAVVPGLTAGD